MKNLKKHENEPTICNGMGACMMDARGGDVAGPGSDGIVNDWKKNLDHPIVAEINGGGCIGGRWTVGQGYNRDGITRAQL